MYACMYIHIYINMDIAIAVDMDLDTKKKNILYIDKSTNNITKYILMYIQTHINIHIHIHIHIRIHIHINICISNQYCEIWMCLNIGCTRTNLFNRENHDRPVKHIRHHIFTQAACAATC